tara:strand:+ start:72 stop:269 length:198 start_codon:yes stop_codon:yes gene_type:complete
LLDNKRKVLLQWININNLYWDILLANSEFLELLIENLDKFNWALLSENPNAIKILEKNQNKNKLE